MKVSQLSLVKSLCQHKYGRISLIILFAVFRNVVSHIIDFDIHTYIKSFKNIICNERNRKRNIASEQYNVLYIDLYMYGSHNFAIGHTKNFTMSDLKMIGLPVDWAFCAWTANFTVPKKRYPRTDRHPSVCVGRIYVYLKVCMISSNPVWSTSVDVSLRLSRFPAWI